MEKNSNIQCNDTLLKQDQAAAQLYLLYWQTQEKPYEEGKDDAIWADCAEKLHLLGYPDPSKVLYDNEACPHIKWRSPDFDCEAYYLTLQDNGKDQNL